MYLLVKDGKLVVRDGVLKVSSVSPAENCCCDDELSPFIFCDHCLDDTIHREVHIKLSGITGTDSFLNGDWILSPSGGGDDNATHSGVPGCMWTLNFNVADWPASRSLLVGMRYVVTGSFPTQTLHSAPFVCVSSNEFENYPFPSRRVLMIGGAALWSEPLDYGIGIVLDCANLWGLPSYYSSRSYPGGTPPTGYGAEALDAIGWA